MPKPRVTRPSRQDFNDSEIFSFLKNDNNSCRFMGRKLPEGAKICWEDEIYICSAGDWEPTGQGC